MPTIHDVARLAGVAPITVSRVINNSGYVSLETRERVEGAIAELGYVPNSLARGLRIKKTKTAALLVTDITNPFWTLVVRGVEDAASRAGFHVFLCNTDESEAKQADYLAALLQKQVDGILLVPVRSRLEPVEMIQRHGAVVVVLDRRVPGAKVDSVRCDSEGGAYKLVSYLIEQGHRHIGVMTGPHHVSTAEDRVTGYRRALTDAGFPLREAYISFGEFNQAGGYRQAQQMLRLTPRPTALFATNNFIMMGAIRAIRDAGMRIPEDISVVTFDESPADPLSEPFLTAAIQPGYEMGQRAMELLLSRLEEKANFQETLLSPSIVIRRSVRHLDR